jgi:hypothetical protein
MQAESIIIAEKKRLNSYDMNIKPSKLRILQIATEDTSIVKQLYEKSPSLKSAPFHSQIETLSHNSIDQGTLLTPALSYLSMETQLVFGNIEDVQLQWAYEHNLQLTYPEFWRYEILLAQIKHFAPTHILISDPYEFDSYFVRMLGAVENRPICLAWLHNYNHNRGTKDWSEFDLFLLASPNLLSVAQTAQAQNIEILPPATQNLPLTTNKSDTPFTLGIFIDNNLQWQDIEILLIPIINNFETKIYHQPLDTNWPEDIIDKVHTHPTNNGELIKTIDELSAVTYVGSNYHDWSKTLFTFLLHNIPVLINTINAEHISMLLDDSILDYYESPDDLITKLNIIDEDRDLTDCKLKTARSWALTSCSKENRAYDMLEILTKLVETKNHIKVQHSHTSHTSPNPQLESITPECAIVSENSTNREPSSTITRNHTINKVLLNLDHADMLIAIEALQAHECFVKGDTIQALAIIDKLISHGHHIPGCHLLRAECISSLVGPMQSWHARNALREELRHTSADKGNQLIIEMTQNKLNILEDVDAKWQLVTADDLFENLYYKVRPYSSLPKISLYSLYRRARLIILRDVPGDFIDIGCQDGGITLLFETLINEHSKQPRKIIAFDSFTGIQKLSEYDRIAEEVYPSHAGWGIGTNRFDYHRTCNNLGSNKVVHLNDLEYDTISSKLTELGLAESQIALAHIDLTTYEPTKNALFAIQYLVQQHGAIVVERGVGIDGVGHAVNEFLTMEKGHFRFVGEECDTIWLGHQKGYSWTDSRVSTFADYL